jgi:acyl-CoA thioester hydrolase
MIFKQRLPIQIRFNDVDMLGHVNNSVYFNYFDLGRVAYFRQVFGSDLDYREKGLIIASTKTDFFKQISLDDKIEVVTCVVRIGNKSFDLLQQVRDVETEEVKCESHTVMVCFNFMINQSIPMPEKWRSDIEIFQEETISN